MNIYVGNLASTTTEDRLRQHFSTFGQIADVKIIKDRDTFESRGFGFVEIPSATNAREAISDLHGKELDGNALVVNEARPREDRGGSFGGPRTYGRR